MTKKEFLFELMIGISGLPDEIINEQLDFYGEMIDDRMEEGLSEEEAVAEIGNPKEIVEQILKDVPFSKLVKERIKSKRKLSGFEILLIILGFPIWLPLLMAAFAVFLSLYVSLLSIIISLWAVNVSLFATVICGFISGVLFFINGNAYTAVAIFGVGFICLGLSIFMFFGCKYITKVLLLLTKKIANGIKGLFIKGGKSNE